MNRYAFVLLLSVASISQHLPALDVTAWKQQQPVNITTPGITRLELPAETLNASRSQFEDIRLLSPSGAESPFIIERSSLTPPRSAAVRDFKSLLLEGATIIAIETGSADAIEAVVLETPEENFIKSARVGSVTDGGQLDELTKDEVIFRQQNGASKLRIPIASASYKKLNVAINDKRGGLVPFTGARIEFTSQKQTTVPQKVAIAKAEEKSRTTAITIDLGAANLHLATLGLVATDPVFSRRIAVSYSQDDNGTTRIIPVASAVIYRLTTNDGLSTESLDVPIDQLIPTSQLTLTIDNGDSAPLHVGSIEATRQPVSLVFYAQESGAWQLITGNRTVNAPRYDLAMLDRQLRQGSAAKAQAGTLALNPDYKEQPALPDVQSAGANIDLKSWRFRKAVTTGQTGVVRVEIDAETLAHAQTSLADLRVIQNEKQIPFLIDHTNASRTIQPEFAKDSDPKRRTVSLWKVTMPLESLPATRLTCTSPTPLFDRTLTIWEMQKDHMGNEYRMHLGSAQWTKQTESNGNEFSLNLSGATPGVFEIETDNGDNPPIEIADLKVHYNVSAVVAKVTDSAPVMLYYGNHDAYAPRYDLQLVRTELLAAKKQNAALGKEEVLRAEKKTSYEVSTGSPWLWASLGLVIVALLWVVSKMLPAASKVD